ncbi:MAG: hypothetical protein MUP58_03615 [Candidatus Nanohaloarchaeota archaeon QJJ-9]|nr:hypothetical protein [Candidatus Nanohaloarchaeota archaeon QJJ-9]
MSIESKKVKETPDLVSKPINISKPNPERIRNSREPKNISIESSPKNIRIEVYSGSVFSRRAR